MVPSRCRRRRYMPGVLFVAALSALTVLSFASIARGQEPAPAPGAPAQQAEPDAEPLVSFGASVGFFSHYVWRGTINGEDPVMQPSTWIRIGPVTVTSWSNTFLPSSGIWYSEHDLLVDYSVEFRGAALSFGWINYAYPKETTGRYTNEFYGVIAGEGYLEPKLQVFHDVNVGNGTYAALGISHEYTLGSSKLALRPAVSVGYNWHQWTDYVGFSDVTMTVGASVPVGIPHLAIEPVIGYTYGIDTSVFPRRLYGGVTLTVQ